MTMLPNGWEWRTLGELCAKPQYGWTTKADRDNDGGLKLLRTTDITRGPIDWDKVPACTEEPEDVGKYRLTKGDLVVSRAGSVGVSALIEHDPPPAVFASYLIRMRPLHADARYIKWFMQSAAYWRAIGQSAAGIALQNVNAKKLAAIRVPVAPPREQHQIVEAIEEELSRLDSGVGSLHRSERNLSRLRASILTSAVDGQIVGLEPFEESSAGLFPIPRGWAWRRAEDVAIVSGGIQKQPKRKPKDNAYPYLRVANVLRGVLDLGEIHEMELFGDELARYRLEVGDLLVVEGNGSESQIGRSAMWGGEIQDCVHQNHIIRVRPSPTLDARFLNLYWNSPSAARRIRAVAASTSGLYTLSTSKVRAVPVPVPPLEVQQAIVAEVDRQLSVVDTMLGAVAGASVRASKLREAVLRDAFSGGLGRGSSESLGAETA